MTRKTAATETDFAKLLLIIGADLGKEVCAQFGGSHVYVPTHDRFMRKHKYRMIKRDLDAGVSVREIARKLGMTTSAVYKVKMKIENGEVQL